MIGRWAQQLWVEEGDVVRVIGTFSKDNDFHLNMDDNYAEEIDNSFGSEECKESKPKNKASMIIVEPQILIPTT